MKYISTLLLFFYFQIAFGQTAGVLLEDQVYSNKIKASFVYPSLNNPDNPTRLVSPPLIQLGSPSKLILEFDDMDAVYNNYRVKFIHCNADWTKSNLNDIEFTYEYNDYPIQVYEQSFSTKVPYYHYKFEIPKLKLSGNYVLVVYGERDKKPVLSRRFMVYENRINIQAQARFSQGIEQQFSDQQIDFSIEYKNYPLIAPQSDLKVFIRKNFRWDQAKTNFKPTNVRPFDQTLEYTFFQLENAFPGGNEFRYFDSRTLSARGYGIESLERESEYTRLFLFPDKPRTVNGYLQMDDLNGNYVVDHRESGRGSVEADYTPVLFTLKVPEDPEATYYVNGGFNLWQLNETNRMEYNPEIEAYQAEIMLKQGIVNYDYTTVVGKNKPDEGLIEGNYATTENDYDILVYHRPPSSRSDLLVGYRTIEWNRRR